MTLQEKLKGNFELSRDVLTVECSIMARNPDGCGMNLKVIRDGYDLDTYVQVLDHATDLARDISDYALVEFLLEYGRA